MNDLHASILIDSNLIFLIKGGNYNSKPRVKLLLVI